MLCVCLVGSCRTNICEEDSDCDPRTMRASSNLCLDDYTHSMLESLLSTAAVVVVLFSSGFAALYLSLTTVATAISCASLHSMGPFFRPAVQCQHLVQPMSH